MNGAGVTHEIEIDALKSLNSDAPFLWRLSMADLTGSGPFSAFPDVDRILVLLHGDNVRKSHLHAEIATAVQI